ncbi:MAG: tetratricopeptide repeat protein [Planctomycetota bacterium]
MTQLSGEQALAQVHRFLRKGDAVSALRLTAEIVRQAPQFAEGHFAHARALIAMGRTATARAVLDRLAEIAPEDRQGEIHVARAEAYLAEHRPEPAEKAARAAVEHAADAPAAAAVLARSLVGLGRGEEAAAVIADARERGLDGLVIAHAAGLVALAAGTNGGGGTAGTEAIEALRERTGKVGAGVGELVPALRTLAELHAAAGDDDAALTVFKRAAKVAAPGVDPAKHREGIGKMLERWKAEAGRLPSLEGEDTATGGRLAIVVGLPGGSGELAAAIASAAGAADATATHAFLGSAMSVFGVEPAGFAVWVAPPRKATHPQLRTVRDRAIASAFAEAGEAPLAVDAAWAQAYGLGVLPMVFPTAKLVVVDRPLADAAVATVFSEGVPRAPFANDAASSAMVVSDLQSAIDGFVDRSGDGPNPILRTDFDALLGEADDARRELLAFLGLPTDADTLGRARVAAEAFGRSTHAKSGLGERFGSRLKDVARVLGGG